MDYMYIALSSNFTPSINMGFVTTKDKQDGSKNGYLILIALVETLT